MPTTHRPNCPAPHCRIRNRHVTDCPQDNCGGCLPRPARDGLILCDVDTARLQTDAARCAVLYRDLELVLIGGAAIGEHVATTGGGPPAPRDEVMEARQRIRYVLTEIVGLIVKERGVHHPTEMYVDPVPDGRVGPPALRSRPTTHTPALARFVARHKDWLGAHRHAVKVAVALREIAGDRQLWAVTYPAGSTRLYVGDCPWTFTDADGVEDTCGTRLYQDPDQPLITCDGCGAVDTIEQWQRWIVGDDGEHHVDAYAIASRLSTKWMRPVDAGLIRVWSHRGKVTPVMEPDPADPERQRPVRDNKNRVLYDWNAVVAYARSLWGPEAPIRGRRAA